MAQYDLRDIKVAKYVNNNGTVTYTGATKAGDAMAVNLEMRNAEGRLYAESTLAEYMRKAVGGTISMGVKFLSDAVQTLLFGASAKSRSITYQVGTTQVTESVTGVAYGANTTANYVGVACYSPCMRDGVQKYLCLFIPKTMFGPPTMTLQTCGENITFQTPTTSGEFLASDATDKELFEMVTVDSEAAAKAWVDAVFAAA
jgi:phi13 family phage major tail protein